MAEALGRSDGVKRKTVRAARQTAKPRKSTADHILAAPKGPRTVSHRRIKDAVEKVFQERSRADA